VKSGESLELALFQAAAQLGAIRDEVVFVGGAVRGLLVTDTGASGVRPTDDVDVIVEATTRELSPSLSHRVSCHRSSRGSNQRRRRVRDGSSSGAPR